MTSPEPDAATGSTGRTQPVPSDDVGRVPGASQEARPDAPADEADVSGADTSVTSGRGADVGERSKEAGNASLTGGLVVDDLEDVDQVAAIPPMPGMSFRGGGADWWEVGETYVEPGWLRSSRDPLVATDNFAGDTVVALFGPHGRDVANLTAREAEAETVFLHGSRITVTRHGDLGGLWVTVVYVHRDDEPAPTPDQVNDEATRAASVLARARTLPRVVIDDPDRFAGEFGRRR